MNMIVHLRQLSLFVLFFGIICVQTGFAEESEYHLDEVYSMSTSGTIHLFSEDAFVRVLGSDRSDVHVVVNYSVRTRGLYYSFESEPFQMEVTEEDGDLIIREMSGDQGYVGFVGSISEEYEILIECPQSVNLQLRGEDDDYLVRDMGGSIELRFEDGHARLDHCGGDHFEFELEDGELEMSGGSGELYLYVEDGNVDIIDGDFTEIDVTGEDGDIEIETTLADDGIYRFEASDGLVDLVVLGGGGEFTIFHDDGGVRATREFNRIENEEHVTILELDGGNARVRIRIEDGLVRLDSDK